MPASSAVAERAMLAALRPFTRRLAVESTLRWLVRGTIVALGAVCLVLGVGWVAPFHAADLRPIAFELALALLGVGLLVGAWPATRVRRAAELDTRLDLSDRLATAWLQRTTASPMAELQRRDALKRLSGLEPERALRLRVARLELLGLGIITLLTLILLVAPSPMENVLRQIEAQQLATQQVADRLDQLSQDPALASQLTPEQQRRLEEVLQLTRANLSQARNQRDAVAALTRAEQQLAQLGNLDADAREQALGAMSETLSQEPLTRRLGDALQRSDAGAAADALQALRDSGNQLSDAQRQALAKALQRAANVGRADSRTSAAMRDASHAIGSGEPADSSLQDASQSIEEAMQASAAEAAIRSATQRVQDLRSDLNAGAAPGERSQDQPPDNYTGNAGFMPSNIPGTAVPIDAKNAQQRASTLGVGRSDPASTADRGGSSGGLSGADLTAGQAGAATEPSESIFIPGRAGEGPTDSQDNVQQPFSVRGAPRPFREVIGQYAQQGRDYVDHASVSPNVRELVRQYFADLEGQ